MTRLVARLVLAMMLLPLVGTIILLFFVAFPMRGGPPTIGKLSSMWGIVFTFIGVYWTLLWRADVRWTAGRRRLTVAVAPASVVVGALVGFFVAGMSQGPASDRTAFGMLIGGGIVPVTWVLSTVLIWRETPHERAERLASTGADRLSCPVCDYNMTGLRESRCPECGTQFTLDQLLGAQRHRNGDSGDRL